MAMRSGSGYQELHVRLGSLDTNLYTAELRFQDETVTGEVAVQMAPDRIDQILTGVWNASDLRPVRKGVQDGFDPVSELGRALFAALFGGPREAFLRRAQERVSGSGQGLRLRFSFVDRGPATLPWEFLYDGRDFLALATWSPVVRSIADGHRPLPSPQERLRVLAVTSDLDFSKGRWKAMTHDLYDGLQKQFEQLSVTIVEDVNLARLQRAVYDPFDVVHFCGHADVVLGDQAMIFLDEKGGYAPARPDQLADALGSLPELKMICLDACYSDLLAVQLAARTRVPAIYGIRNVISDESADSFIRGFLSALLSGQTLTAAATQGRQEIDRERPGSREWGLPVVYTGTPDGQLVLSSWQTSYTGTGSGYSKGLIDSPPPPAPPEAVRGEPNARPSRERQKLEISLTLKRKNLQALEDQLANSSYAPPEVQAQVTGLRDEIETLQAQLAQTR